jgi:predicted DNA-binding transcriptional regulator YafY
MDKIDRIFQLHAIFHARKTPISLQELTKRLECSKSTLHRALNLLRDYLHAPIEFDEDAGGYSYATTDRTDKYELPGLWFTPGELQALAVIQRLIKDAGEGFLEVHLGPLSKRLDELTAHKRLNLSEAASRLRFPAMAARPTGSAFQVAISATLQRKKLRIHYHARGTDQYTERTVSPQRVVHYREAWYLDAWDEGKQEFRSFSIDRILEATVLKEAAKNISEGELDAHFASSFGIFGGQPDKTAILHFTPERARWVAAEYWHPEKQSRYLQDGTYELKIPYRNSPELIMEILRHGPHVRVIEPQTLRTEVKRQLAQALALYPE